VSAGGGEDNAARILARYAGICGLLACTISVATTILGGQADPDYSHSSQFISELGAAGALQRNLVNFAGFLPTGLFLFGFVLFGHSSFPPAKNAVLGWWLLTGASIGYVIAALFPCDTGCPATGSIQQAVHNTAGMIQYIGISLGLLLIAKAEHSLSWLRPISLLAAAAILSGFIMMSVDHDLRGMWQRVAEVAFFGWVLLVSIHLLSTSR